MKEIIVLRRKLTSVLAVLSCKETYFCTGCTVMQRKLSGEGNLLLYWLYLISTVYEGNYRVKELSGEGK